MSDSIYTDGALPEAVTCKDCLQVRDVGELAQDATIKQRLIVQADGNRIVQSFLSGFSRLKAVILRALSAPRRTCLRASGGVIFLPLPAPAPRKKREGEG